MKVYVGQTRSRRLIEELTGRGIGECTARGELPPRRRPWFYDNGAFRDWKAARPFDGDAFSADVDRIRRDGLTPDFLVVPDVVAGGDASLAFSLEWRPRLVGVAPLYLAIQDGMSPLDEEFLAKVLDFDGFFVGGGLQWKLSHGARWVNVAHRLRKPCHVGRVGTADRVEWAHQIGADSIDSSLPLWSDEQKNRFLGAVFTKQMRMFPPEAL